MKKNRDEDDDATDPMDMDDSSSSSEEEEGAVRRPRRRSSNNNKAAGKEDVAATAAEKKNRRSSSRSTRFAKSMKEPPSDSVKDLFAGSAVKPHFGTSDDDDDDDNSHEDDDAKNSSSDSEAPLSLSLAKQQRKQQQLLRRRLDVKSPARRHSRARKSLPHEDHEDHDDLSVEQSSEEEDEEDMKIQRILASRTETKRKWRDEIGQSMNTSEVTDGSRWFQEPNSQNDDDDDEEDSIIEERFLVKWSNLSYLHVSWETQKDLIDQIDGAKTYLSTFFRKSQNGLLLSSDERKDGDYFDPGFVQIDRILEVETGKKNYPNTWKEEQESSPQDFGIVVDKRDAGFEDGTGRQILIKWESVNYSDSTYEFERDLMLADIEYRPALEAYYERTHKQTKKEISASKNLADTALRRSYKLFGDATDMVEDKQQEQVTCYQKELANHVFLNGGQLRDYQAEGVSWFLANYVNRRSCIMADEMGLGKVRNDRLSYNL